MWTDFPWLSISLEGWVSVIVRFNSLGIPVTPRKDVLLLPHQLLREAEKIHNLRITVTTDMYLECR